MNIKLESQISEHKDALLNKLNDLIIGERKRHLHQYEEGATVAYRTVKETLTDRKVLEHIEGEKTFGCYYFGGYSKFLCFDIDEPDPAIPMYLIKLLRDYGFEKNHLHLEHSGSKGWHLWIFLKDKLPINKLTILGRYVIDELGSYGEDIELRPENPSTSRRH